MIPYTVTIYRGCDIGPRLAAWSELVCARGGASPSRDPRWLSVLAEGLRHEPFCIEARAGDRVVGILPLVLVRSVLFGRFLVGLSYLNVGGPLVVEDDAAAPLIESAARLADELNVRYLELRHEQALEHPALGQSRTSKVHMRLDLPTAAKSLWESFDPKVRNQVRKGEKANLSVSFGGAELLSPFYSVFAHNMRDLGTPVFGRSLFAAILRHFPQEAEICVVTLDRRPVAAALLMHGPGQTEVPSASSLREYNSTNANMLMYWHLLQRAMERGNRVFDFGRSTIDSNTYRFKRQWGAQAHPACWQYYVRRGTIGDMRPESGNYGRLIRLWQRLPVPLTRLIGPAIVRGIP